MSKLYTLRPGETVTVGSENLPANAIMRAMIEYAFPSKPIAGLRVDGIGKDGDVLFSLTLLNARNTVKTPFLTKEETLASVVIVNQSKKDTIDIGISGIRIEKLHDNSPAPKISFGKDKVTVALATYPLRHETFPDILSALVGQADNLLVYLNNYREVPECLRKYGPDDGVHYILETASEKRAAAKFTWIRNEGFHVICDDDILYPPDYVSTTIDAVRKYSCKAVVGYHAALFPEMVVNDGQPYRKQVFHFKDAVDNDEPVHLLGTGTIGLHSDAVKNFDWDLILKHNISNDQSFAVNAKRNGVPLVVLKREAGWLKSHPKMNYGVFDEKKLVPGAGSAAIALLQNDNPWVAPTLPAPNTGES